MRVSSVKKDCGPKKGSVRTGKAATKRAGNRRQVAKRPAPARKGGY